MVWMAATADWSWLRLLLLLVVSIGPADGTDCGGELTQQAGVILSPNFPQNYPGFAQCSWTITVAEDQVIALSFQRLDLRRRSDQNCYDYLAVYDGPDRSSSFIEDELCGYQNESKVADIRLRSSGNQMHLYFYASSSESWPGFSASYQARNACMPFMYGRGDCNTPCACNQSNTLYCNSLDGDCVCKEGWTLPLCNTPCACNQSNTLRCNSVDGSCVCKEGWTLPSCNTPCACNQSNTLYCNSVDGSCVCKAGWTSSLCTVDVDECQNPNRCRDVYSECQNTPGSFECPCKAGFVKNENGFCEGSGPCPVGTRPDPSDGNNCTECDDWTFGYNCTQNCVCSRENTESCDKVDGTCSCYLNWTGISCTQDVNECWYTNLACNSTSSSRCVNTYGSYECRCRSGYEHVDDSLRSCQECGRILIEPSGSITSSWYIDRGQNSEECSWTIRAAEGNVISLNVSEFSHDYRYPNFLSFFDGGSSSSRLIQRLYSVVYYSTFSYEGIIRSSGNEMHIVLYSSRCVNQEIEFIATYWSHECPDGMYGEECRTPCQCNHTNTYCNSTTGQCVCKEGWRSENCSVDIDECSEDPLACPDYSDCTNLNGSFVCTCKEGLTNTSGLCVAPNSGPDSNINCTEALCAPLCVTIDQNSGTSMELCYCPIGMVLDGDSCVDCNNMTYGPECRHPCKCLKDHTASCEPRNGSCTCVTGWTGDMCEEDVNECYRQDECGYTLPNPCPSYSRCHNTEGSYNCTCKFEDGYEQAGRDSCVKFDCIHNYTASFGNITSPGYPDYYFDNADCSWSVTVEEGRVISLRFLDFHLEEGYDYLKVYDGTNNTAALLGQYTSELQSKVIRSTGNSMYIVFTSDSSIVRKGFTGTYVSHYCQEFTYGELDCDSLCPCERLNTFHCENTNGWCLCKDGWTGNDCTENVNECLGTNVDLCPENSDCEDTVGSYTCVCHPGYVFNDTTKECDVKNECATKQCSHSCFITDEEEEQCVCPEDLVLDRAENLTCVVPYYPYGTAHGDNSLQSEGEEEIYNFVSAPIRFSPGVPFGTKEQAVAFVLTSGIISFGERPVPLQPNLTDALSSNRSFIVPFWSLMSKDKGQTYYQLYEKCSAFGNTSSSKDIVMKRAEEDITKFYNLHGFEVNNVLLVTWEAVEPLGSQGDEQNTFQGIYISGWKKELQFGKEILSDEQTAYVIFLYQKGMMKWKYVEGRTIEIGTTRSGKIQTRTELLGELAGNTGYNGVLTFEIGKVGGDRQKCHKYVCNHAELLSDPVYEAERNGLYNCPCTLERLGRQWQLLEIRGENRDIYCYAISILAKRRLLQGNNRNKLCCYKWVQPVTQDWYVWEQARRQAPFVTGHVLISDPWFFWWRHNFDNFQARENIQAQQWCCNDVYSTELCERFYRVFPKQECTNFVTFVTGAALGDPHITTADGLTYTLNGWGEYVLLNVPTENFTLQARTGRAESSRGTLTNATVFIAFAAKESNYSFFQVELATTNTTMVIIANGIDLTNEFYDDFEFERATETIDVARQLNQNQTAVVVTFPCGVTIKASVAVKSLQIEFELDKTLQNKTRGLLGNFNGRKDDEFTLPNGTVLASNISEREIFYHFGKSWEVTAENSVFTYEAGENARDHQHPDFVPMFRDEADPEAVADAEKVCGTDNDACIFDYLVTRDTAFAENTKLSKERYDILRINLENNPPTIEMKSNNVNNSNQLVIHNGTETKVQYVIKDADDNDTAKLEFVTNSSLASMDESGTVTTVTFGPYVYDGSQVYEMFGVRAVDSKGGYSQVIYTPVFLCTGCSGHGKCSDTTIREKKPGDSFFKLACNCLPAYTGDDCESEVDACESKPCFPGQSCTDLTAAVQGNSSFGYTCGSCPDGFRNQNRQCIDIDECSTNNPCEQLCTNTEGSYFCHCHEGYRVDPEDKHECSDIDECGEKLHNCESYCDNKPGNYSCRCWDDYILRDDGHTCRRNFQPGHVCLQKKCEQKCEAVDGQATCTCANGYEKDPENEIKCLDVNECELDNMPCNQVCNNTVGSYNCSCYPGYTLDVDRVSCSLCEKPYYGENCANVCQCSGRGTCDPFRGCVCDDAWTGTNCETDVDECTNPSACPLGLVCDNEIGSYSCLCPEGYQETDTGSCQDINECTSLEANITCDLSIETCENTVGSYRCLCQSGYVLENSRCTDINECATRGDACEQVCENVPGSYNCLCNPGYQLAADRRSCVKIKDLCLNSQLNCSHICSVNASGLPYCSCPRGYQLTDSEICEDIDECAHNDTNDCAYKGKWCTNTEGSYQCSCPAGLRLANDGRSCDACTGETWGLECANSCACGLGTDHCDAVAGCLCHTGFTGTLCNEDINECQNGQVMCPSKEVCLNTPGSAACVCQDGYTRLNGTCVDIDECDDARTNICPHKCTNTEGSFSCSCFTGYTFDTDTGECKDVDECSSTAQCQQKCTNTEGSYRCSCQSGLLLQPDGVSCASSLPCPTNHSCSDRCINLGVNLTCLCPRGKALSKDDSTQCEDVDLCANASCSDGCIETNGNRSYQCVCRSGQQLEADHITCSDCPDGTWGIDCANQCQCVETNTDSCNKVNGSCTCKTGWKGDLCDVDINECVEGTVSCPEHSSCNNTEGGYVCVCDDGYFNSGSSEECKECDDGYYGKSCTQRCTCGDNFDCNKVNGSCSCSQGWKGTNCDTDVNECEENSHDCDSQRHELCVNIDGGFNCQCQAGYWRICASCQCQECEAFKFGFNCSQSCECNRTTTDYCNATDGSCVCNSGWRGQDCFQDVDECVDDDLCPDHSTCRNGDGSYTCVCDEGYNWEEATETCQECEVFKFGRNCSQSCECNRTTTNYCNATDGSCLCKSGWRGQDCSQDVDECVDDLCPDHSSCRNRDGSYTCPCDKGYSWVESTKSCQDVDECAVDGNSPCEQTCTNTDGSFDCSCGTGFMKNQADPFQCFETSVYNMTLVFGYEEIVDLSNENTDDYRNIKLEIELLVKGKLENKGLPVVAVTVISLRKGSIDTELGVVMNKEEGQGNTTDAFTDAMIGMFEDNSTFNGIPAPLKLLSYNGQTYSVSDTPCEIRQKRDPCAESETCVEGEDRETVCRAAQDSGAAQDSSKTDLILGLALGIPCFLIVCALVAVLVYCNTKKRNKKVEEPSPPVSENMSYKLNRDFAVDKGGKFGSSNPFYFESKYQGSDKHGSLWRQGHGLPEGVSRNPRPDYD